MLILALIDTYFFWIQTRLKIGFSNMSARQNGLLLQDLVFRLGSTYSYQLGYRYVADAKSGHVPWVFYVNRNLRIFCPVVQSKSLYISTAVSHFYKRDHGIRADFGPVCNTENFGMGPEVCYILQGNFLFLFFHGKIFFLKYCSIRTKKLNNIEVRKPWSFS